MKIFKVIISFTILISLFHTSGSAQKHVFQMMQDPVSRGDELFNEFAYASAIDAYKKGLDGTSIPLFQRQIQLKIAESYRMLNEPELAAQWYEKVLEDHDQEIDALYSLHYAEALSSEKKYAKAKEWYEKYNTRASSDSRGSKKISTISDQKQLYRNESNVSIAKAPFNSDASDFSPSMWGDAIVFVSSRDSDHLKPGLFNWDNSNYLDLYVFQNGEVSRLDKIINSKFHEGPAAFYNNGYNIIFTRNNYYKGKIKQSSEGITKLKLYRSQKDANGDWTPPVPLPFNDDEYSVGHPTISEDGTTLYFASDMPGGQGGVDIYKTQWIDDKWQEPVNAGPEINTEGNEVFPFLQGSNLYFASSGHGGLGGLDIFVADVSQDDIVIYNVGSPINSSLDDFALVTDETQLSGYFSSNRDGSGNKDDIYTFSANSPMIIVYQVSGKVFDKKENRLLKNVEVVLLNEAGKTINTVLTDEQGEYTMTVEPNQKYTINVTQPDYLDEQMPLVTTGNDNTSEWTLDIPMTRNYGFVLEGKILDKQSKKGITGVNVNILDNLTNQPVLETTTDERGIFKYPISDYELDQRVSYQIKLAKESYLTKMAVYNTKLTEPGIYDLTKTLDLAMDKIEIGTDIGKLIDIKPIYFDVGKYNIRPDAAAELNKVVAIMQENPAIQIELGSHTDSRGSAKSNLALSDKRAKASAEYIISQGIAPERIVGKGYGEEQIINQCTDGVTCSAEDHQLNRRTEFKVTKF